MTRFCNSKELLALLDKNNLMWLTEEHSGINIDLQGRDETFISHLIKAMKDNLHLLVYTDPDTDGVLTNKLLIKFFNDLGYRNYTIYPLVARNHGIDMSVVRAVVANYDGIIITDSSTNNMEELQILSQFNKKVFLLDHHMSDYSEEDYPKNVNIINYRLFTDKYEMSSGALLGLILYNLMMKYNKRLKALDYLKLGALTIYSDSCTLDEGNVSILRECIEWGGSDIPQILKPFTDNYCIYGRSFANFKLSNRINAVLRENRLDLINSWMKGIIFSDEIEEVYEQSRAYKNYLLESFNTEIDDRNFSNIVLTTIEEDEDKAENYTGLIANDVIRGTNKLSVALFKKRKGSVRDPQNRDILSTFKTRVECGGHKPAFGFRINEHEYREFLSFLSAVDDHLEIAEKKLLVVNNWNNYDLGLMARINEYSDKELLARIDLNSGDKIKKIGKLYKVSHKEWTVRSFTPILPNTSILVKPTISHSGIELTVKSTIQK